MLGFGFVFFAEQASLFGSVLTPSHPTTLWLAAVPIQAAWTWAHPPALPAPLLPAGSRGAASAQEKSHKLS